MLIDDIKNVIIKKAQDINKNDPLKLRDEVKSIIDKLMLFIEEGKTLTDKEIKTLCQKLLCFTTLAPIPIDNDLISRARQDKSFFRPSILSNPKMKIDYFPSHINVQELSYIHKSSGVIPLLGRMNKKGNSMFYGSLGADANTIGTVLSEVHAQKGQVYNILISEIKKPIYVSPIGIFDYFRRGVQHPFDLHSDFKEMYNLYKEKTNEHGFIALQLCDAFLTYILQKEYHIKEVTERQYLVTSEIANDCFNGKLDGLIYPSVKFEGFPNIVLRPEVVDRCLEYKSTVSLEILEKLGFGIYHSNKLYEGSISSNNINWIKIQ